jgi:hypothetical protein
MIRVWQAVEQQRNDLRNADWNALDALGMRWNAMAAIECMPELVRMSRQSAAESEVDSRLSHSARTSA